MSHSQDPPPPQTSMSGKNKGSPFYHHYFETLSFIPKRLLPSPAAAADGVILPSNPRLAEIYKGNSEIHQAAAQYSLLSKIPHLRFLLLPSHLIFSLVRLLTEYEPVVIAGPHNKITAPVMFGHSFGATVSTYPQLTGKRSREVLKDLPIIDYAPNRRSPFHPFDSFSSTLRL